MRRPRGWLRADRPSRSDSQRLLVMMAGPSGSGSPFPTRIHASLRNAPSRQIGAPVPSPPRRREGGEASCGGIERLLERGGAQARVGGEERLARIGAQLEIAIDHLLHRIDDAVGAEARTGDGGERGVLGAGAAQQQLVVLLAALLHAQDADVADMVMAAGVDAARDLDLEIADLVLAGRQTLGDALRYRDRA